MKDTRSAPTGPPGGGARAGNPLTGSGALSYQQLQDAGPPSIKRLDNPVHEEVGAAKDSDLALMFKMKGSVIPRISGLCLGCALIGIIGLYIINATAVEFNDYLHRVVVMPLGFLLVFRSNLAYGRFWESRGHVGCVLRTCRMIACKVGTKCNAAALPVQPCAAAGGGGGGPAGPGGSGGGAAEPGPISAAAAARAAQCARASAPDDMSSCLSSVAERSDGGGGAAAGAPPDHPLTRRDMAIEMHRLLILLYYVVVHTLRDSAIDPSDHAMEQLTEGETEELTHAAFKPVIVVRWCMQHVQAIADAGLVTWWEHQAIIMHLDNLVEATIGAHKVASTPIPFPYTQMLSWLVYVFILTVPLTIATAYLEEDGAHAVILPFTAKATQPGAGPAVAGGIGVLLMVAFSSAMIAFALLGINETAAELEAPFGFDENDIPLGALGERMELDVTVLLKGIEAAKVFQKQHM